MTSLSAGSSPQQKRQVRTPMGNVGLHHDTLKTHFDFSLGFIIPELSVYWFEAMPMDENYKHAESETVSLTFIFIFFS